MKGKITVLRADGSSTIVEIENDLSLEQVAEFAGLVSGKLAINGEAASPDDTVSDGDVVEEHRTAEGA